MHKPLFYTVFILLISGSPSFGMNNKTNFCDVILSKKLTEEQKIEAVKRLVQEGKEDANKIYGSGNSFKVDRCNLLYVHCSEVVIDEEPLIDQDTRRFKGFTPLFMACYYLCSEIAIELLKHPYIDINKACKSGDYEGWTPLCIACNTNNLKIVTLLLEHSATVDQKSLKKSKNNSEIQPYLELTKNFDSHRQFGTKFNAPSQRDKNLFDFSKLLFEHRKVKYNNPKIIQNTKSLKKFRDVKIEFED